MNTLEKAPLLAARLPLKFQDTAIEKLNLIYFFLNKDL